MDDFNEGWVPATYLEPLYGAHDDEAHTQILSPGEGGEEELEGGGGMWRWKGEGGGGELEGRGGN